MSSFTSTPRQPLMDLKHVNCPVPSDENVRKPLTPIYTPRNTSKNRRKKSSLAFEDKENEGSSFVKPVSDVPVLREEEEDGVEQFVYQVLDRCVTHLKTKQATGSSQTSSEESSKNTDEECEAREKSTAGNDTSSSVTAEEQNDSSKVKAGTPRNAGNYSIINEDELLGNESLLAESFADSTKSEEELLASFVQTPLVRLRSQIERKTEQLDSCMAESQQSLNATENKKECETILNTNQIDGSTESNIDSAKPVENKPNYFLENVALMQRVRNATSSLASWVFPQEKQDYHVQWMPEKGSAKVMHSVACSPMPQGKRGYSDSFEVHTDSAPIDGKIELSPFDKNDDDEKVHNDNKAEVGINDSDEFDSSSDQSATDGAELNQNKVGSCTHTCYSDEVESTCVDCSLNENESEQPGEATKKLLTSLLEEMKENTSLLDDLEQGIQAMTPNKCPSPDKSFHSIACSPIMTSASVCEVSIQNEVQTRTAYCSPMKLDNQEISVQYECNNKSAMCSPIRFGNHDISIQNTVENKSMMCSPIKFENHDVSIQNTVENKSMMCSPIRLAQNDISIQYGPESHSVMCSPMPRVPVLDVSVQNIVESQSFACSPMVPRANQDKSVLMSGPDCTDQCVGTASVSYTDVEVSVHPEQMTVGTEVDDCLMTSTSTSMTPIRMDKKNGKKLTAEDVRKQHPRVLANELETLRMENSRLEAHSHSLEKDRKKLILLEETQEKLAGVESELSALECRYSSEKVEWQTRVETLQRDMETLAIQHTTESRYISEETRLETPKKDMGTLAIKHNKEMNQLQEDYESTNYRDHFFASQKLVKQLQAELDQYTKLLEDLEQAHSLQNEVEQAMADGFSKVKQKTEWIKAQAKKNQERTEELEGLIAQNEQQKQVIAEDKRKIVVEREEMNTATSSLQQQLQQLQGQLSTTQTELEERTNVVDTLTQERDNLQKEETLLCGELDSARQENESLQEEKDRLTTEVFQLYTSLTTTENQLQQAQARLKEEKESLEKKIAQLAELNETKSLEATNLQRTLDNRESEIDILERDLFECRELLYNQQEAIKTLESEKRQRTAELCGFKAEVKSLKESLSCLQQREQDLCTRLKSTESELTETQDTASIMIKQRETEINLCSDTINQLVGQMTNIRSKLTKRAGLKVEETLNMNCTQPTESKQGPSSLVSQILSAANTLQKHTSVSQVQTEESEKPVCDNENLAENSEPVQDYRIDNEPVKEKENEAKNMKNNNIDTNQPSEQSIVSGDAPHIVHSKKKLTFSENSAFKSIGSAFAPVKEPVNQINDQVDTSANMEKCVLSNNSVVVPDTIIKPSTPPTQMLDKTVVSSLTDTGEANKGKENLKSQMDKLTEVFEDVMRVAHLIEKALRSSLNDITFENEDLQSQANQCFNTERRLRAEMSWTREELEKSERETDKLRRQLEEMGDKFGDMLASHSSAQRYQDEAQEVKSKLEAVESERDLLQTQISNLLQKIESGAGNSTEASSLDIGSQREILNLQAKIEKYRSKLIEKENLVEEISSKTSKRIQKLHANWTKADAEVCRLDELVDAIRSSLVRHNLIQRDEKLAKVISVIDGRESLSVLKIDK